CARRYYGSTYGYFDVW
nr:immunoglobulin heavy chain junction region [Mus musculus]